MLVGYWESELMVVVTPQKMKNPPRWASDTLHTGHWKYKYKYEYKYNWKYKYKYEYKYKYKYKYKYEYKYKYDMIILILSCCFDWTMDTVILK